MDAGVRTGLAFYGTDGRLKWYRSTNFGSQARLRLGARSVLLEAGRGGVLAIEGGGPNAEAWVREAGKLGFTVMRVSAERWRPAFMNERQMRTGQEAKREAGRLAREVIKWSGAKKPAALRHDAAEAILIGLWAVVETGWTEGPRLKA